MRRSGGRRSRIMPPVEREGMLSSGWGRACGGGEGARIKYWRRPGDRPLQLTPCYRRGSRPTRFPPRPISTFLCCLHGDRRDIRETFKLIGLLDQKIERGNNLVFVRVCGGGGRAGGGEVAADNGWKWKRANSKVALKHL